MKKRFIFLIFVLAAALCAGVGFTGCNILAGLNPDHAHTPSETWKGDSTYHWHECTAFGCSEQIDKAEHTLEYVAGVKATCTEDGSVEYWHCTGCGKNYSSSNATSELKTLTISATGHNSVTMYDESSHWEECVNCNKILTSPQAHTSSTYIKSEDGHYKICSECGAKFEEVTHISGQSCAICGYDANHTHTPSVTWEGDSTYHWHECTIPGCGEQMDKAEHTLEYVAANEATCTEDGNVEYWHCTVCGKNYSSAYATTELSSVVIDATGHKEVTKYDETTHWTECDNCGNVITSPQAHTSSTYIKDKEGHYKICAECGVKFDEGTHNKGEDCLICGYIVGYDDVCSSDYGYNYLGTLADGESYQSFYKAMDELVRDFHSNNEKDAAEVSLSGGTVYVAGEVNYSVYGLTVSQAQCVWSTYRHDHPLYYWMSGQVLFNSNALSPCVDADFIDGGTRAVQNNLIYIAIDEYLNVVNEETSAYQKAFALHDMIIDNISYAYGDDGEAETGNWAHSILGVLYNKSAVCEGYAKAFALLLNASGVENVYVTGTSKGIGHAWNMVNIDGAWYWYDLTWDDQPRIGGGIVYNYLCCSGEEFVDHTVGVTGDINSSINFLYALPDAATEDYNSTSLEFGEQFESGNFTYEVCGYNSVSLESTSSLTGSVVLAESVTYGGRTYVLTQIGTDAFKNNRNITSLTIPKSVEVIYNKSFVNCTRLSSIIFEDKTGWSRIPNDGMTTTYSAIDESYLQSTASAAVLLKELYNLYTYTWVKN